MMRFIVPVVLVAAAIGLFVLYTNPQYQKIKSLQAQVSSYSSALDQAKQLRSERDALDQKRDSISADNISRLEHALPNSVDNIRLIIDINNIASRHGLSLGGISVGQVSDSSTQRSALAVGSSGDPVGSVDIDFTVGTDYPTFLAFLHDLEHSLRIIDVEKIAFQTGNSNTSTYSLSIRTYWLH